MTIRAGLGPAAVTALALVTIPLVAACDEPNPAYLGVPGGDASAGGRDGAASGGASGEAGHGEGGQGEGGQGEAGSPGGGQGGEEPDALPEEDARVRDCSPERCRELRGDPPCAAGEWACESDLCVVRCPDCTDRDGDGFGVGAGCAGPDCDDADPRVGAEAETACYDGPQGSAGRGECRAGQRTCRAGRWGPCTGQALPSAEACNGLDDDCNGQTDDGLGSLTCGAGVCAREVPACPAGAGAPAACTVPAPQVASDGCGGGDEDCDGAIDEDCAEACVWVSPDGSADPNGTRGRPFRSIQAAIDHAAARAEGQRQVCVASGASCGASHRYELPDGAPLVMRNGVSLYGGYATVNGQRCPAIGVGVGGAGATELALADPRGILFGRDITSPTVLDGFRLLRDDTETSAAVTVDGGKQIVLANLIIPDINDSDVMRSYGVNVVAGGEVTILRSAIVSGRAREESIAVRVSGARVVLRDNCRAYDNRGRCASACGEADQPGLRGQGGGAAARVHAVLLDGAAGSRIERSALCAQGGGAGAVVRVQGDAAGVFLRGNHVAQAGAGGESHGVWFGPCGGARPALTDNFLIEAAPGGGGNPSRSAAVLAEGACHPVIDNNVQITGVQESNAGSPTGQAHGVLCTAAGGTASLCAILANAAVRGARAGTPATATAVRCEQGACAAVRGNLITGGAGRAVEGIRLGKTGAIVAGNLIFAGCAAGAQTGVVAADSWARLENNRVFGSLCESDGGGRSVGLHVLPAAGSTHEVDVHSNLLDGLGRPGACTSHGLLIEADQAASASGSYRNNIVLAGNCESRAGVRLTAPFRPRHFQHNDLVPAGGAPLWQVGANAPLPLAGVNQLPGASGNISALPGFVLYRENLNLQAGSPCIDAGTPTGAPPRDAAGRRRDARPDIGPFEFAAP